MTRNSKARKRPRRRRGQKAADWDKSDSDFKTSFTVDGFDKVNKVYKLDSMRIKNELSVGNRLIM